MTNEEAIIDIRENIQPIIGGKSLDIAVSALEKQIPKKLISTPTQHEHFCPTCHQPIKLGRQYCGSCGQKIGYGSDTE